MNASESFATVTFSLFSNVPASCEHSLSLEHRPHTFSSIARQTRKLFLDSLDVVFALRHYHTEQSDKENSEQFDKEKLPRIRLDKNLDFQCHGAP